MWFGELYRNQILNFINWKEMIAEIQMIILKNIFDENVYHHFMISNDFMNGKWGID